MLSSQQCTLLQRTEVPLEPRSVPSSHPFRVATFNILVRCSDGQVLMVVVVVVLLLLLLL
jgi:hypothetical protein